MSVPAAADVDIKVRFEGVKGDLKDKLEEVSTLEDDEERERIDSAAALRHAAENDLSTLEAVLRSEGFYIPEIDYEVTGGDNRYVLTYRVTPGKRFKITDYRVSYTDEIDDGRPRTLQEAGLTPDGSPRGAALGELQRGLLKYLHNNGFPAARIEDRRVEAMPATARATVEFQVESGPRAVYGEVRWNGLERTDEPYVERFVPWTQGEKFRLDRLTEFRDALARTELFTAVEVSPGATGPEGVTPILVQVTERPPRTIGAGASYSTNLGAGGRVFWEHRNLFGSAERMNIELNGTQVKQFGVISFRKPRPPERGSWFTRLEGGNEDSDAFTGLNVNGRFGFQRKIGKHWGTSVAAEVEWSEFEDSFGQRTSWLGALPVTGLYDTKDDILNPTGGVKIAADLTPAGGLSDGDPFWFGQFQLKGTGYVPFDDDADYLMALWGRFGATLGAPIEQIPANRRYYSGGAGSVRGYGYQLLSPLDENNDPIGGRSVLEGGVEFRVKFTKSIGMVAFIEAGSASLTGIPETSDILPGAGLGFRYFTPIGPVRLDVAVPLDRRPVDDSFQFYISLGQAF